MSGSIPIDDNAKPGLALFDPVTHKLVAAQAGTTATDAATGIVYAPLSTGGGGGGGGTQYTDGTAAPANPIGTQLIFKNGATMAAVSAAVPLPISGSISATNPSVSTDGAAIPLSSTLVGASDGTNLQPLQVESAANKNLRVGVYSGANEATVTGANALKVDGSAVTQPVSGAVTVSQATAASLNATATIQAVTGTALAADQTNSELRVSTYVKTTTAGDTALALGQATKAASLPVALASDQGNLPENLTQVGGAAIALGATTSANSMPVVIASDQAAVATKMPTSATGTLTSVAGTVAASTQLLAANANRKGMYIYNESTAILYLGFNATVTTGSYTLQIPAQGFFEMPTAPVYTGVIAGVWSAANGNARITEMS